MKKIFFVLLLSAVALAAQAQQPGNLAAQLFASAGRSAVSVVTTDQTNNTFSSIHVIIRVSSYGSGNYTPTLQGKDPVSGQYYTLLTGPVVSSTGVTTLRLGPGFATASSATNAATSDMLPKTWRLALAGASTPSMVFSVGAFLH